jgi:hypothetical protein
MNIQALTDQLLSKTDQLEVPKAVSILELRRWSVDELQRRMRKWLRASGDACGTAFDHGEWSVRDDHTLVRLPQGARAELFHASGAFKLSNGLAPMENLFKEMPSVKELAERAEKFIASLGVREQLGRNEALTFERMWKIKAAAENREGKRTDPVLCRAVGAFRHQVEGLPVYGPASVAVQIAGDGSLDSFTTLLRGPAFETLEQAKVLSPERAAKGLLQQLSAQFGSSQQGAQRAEPEFECKDGLRLGYMSLGKRKAQRLLAPVYVATIDVTHEQESQGLVMVVAATEKNYLPLNPPGSESSVSEMGKTAMRKCC